MFKKAIIATAVLAASTGLAFANGGTYQAAPHATHSVYVGVAVSRDFMHFNGIANGAGDAGWDGELNTGIGWVFQDHYYLGAEIFGTINNAKIGSTKYKYSYGIDLVPGVKISDSTMLYGKVGYIRGKFSNITLTGGDKTLNGLQLGLGMETMVTNNVSAKIEYDYNRFASQNFGAFGSTRPTVETVKLGVAYHFMSA